MKLNINNLTYKALERLPRHEDIKAWFKTMPSSVSWGILNNFSDWEHWSDYKDSAGFNKKLRKFSYNGKTKKKVDRETIRKWGIDVDSTIEEDELD